MFVLEKKGNYVLFTMGTNYLLQAECHIRDSKPRVPDVEKK